MVTERVLGQAAAILHLEMKTVLQLERQLSRIREVRASESVAVVEHVVIVADVQRAEAQVPVFSKRLTHRQVHRRVRRQVRWALAIQETGSVVDVEGRP